MADSVSVRRPPDRRRALDRALEGYRRRGLSLGRASELAGVPLTIFLDELRRAGIPRDYGADELCCDLEWASQA